MTATYIYLGYGVTDSNGKAKLEYDAQGNHLTHSYTGTGAGEVDIVASLDSSITDSSLVSETYEIDDCYWIETGSTISGMYSNSGGTLTLNDGVFSLTRGSGTSYFYLNVPKTSLPIADFVNKELTVKTDVIKFGGTNLRLTLMYNDGSWSTGIIKDITTTGLLEQSINIPSNATQVRIRFDIGGNENDSIQFKDFRLLLS